MTYASHRPISATVAVGRLFSSFAWALSCVSVLATALELRSEDNRPNIVLILADDAGYNEFGFANALTGYPTTNAVTPRLDQLAAQSMVLREGYVSASLCTTSRMGLLLGQYPQQYGYEENLANDINETFGLSGETVMPARLKELGYSTGAVGKWHIGSVDGLSRPQDVGFDEFFGFLGGARGYFAGDSNPANVMRRGDTNIESSWVNAANGGYATDAYGLEAVSFINNHANDSDPFFLYVAFSAPHTPFSNGPNGNGTTAADYNDPRIASITNTTDRTVAALNLGMDRNVGRIVDALQNQGIDDNTIVVFMSDNGGLYYSSSNPPHANNDPFNGFKGLAFEGSIRVPFLIKAPGLAPGVYEEPVSTYDLLPTFLNAAGGNPSFDDAAGVDVMPYLSGETAGSPHEAMFWRGRNFWAVRKGDWKYTRPQDPKFNFPYLFNLGATSVEGSATNQLSAQPQIAADLHREFTHWEATLAKPKWGVLGSPDRDRNLFDHFVFRNDLAATTTWGTANAWRQAGTVNNATLKIDDAYANAILEFTTRNDANYTATNDMARMSGLTFMLNQLRLSGNFAGAANRQATINGGALSFAINGVNTITSASNLLFAKSLTGELPRLQLDATASTANKFTFQVAHQLELLDDLEITGDGTQDFVFTGGIREFDDPRNVVKSGASRITLQGASTFRGNLTINGGEVRLTGASAALNSLTGIQIGSSGTLRLDGGRIAASFLTTAPGSQFQFNGGKLEVDVTFGNLTNSGGDFAPGGAAILQGIVTGNFAQTSGRLQLALGGVLAGVSHDTLAVDGTAALGGKLDVDLVNGFVPTFGQRFKLLTASSVMGSFTGYELPVLAGGTPWSLKNDGQSLFLLVGLPGDYNGNNKVDAADYTTWRNTQGLSVSPGSGADGNRDGIVNNLDYALWRSNFGAVIVPNSGSGALFGETNVPEPATLVLAVFALVAIVHRRVR